MPMVVLALLAGCVAPRSGPALVEASAPLNGSEGRALPSTRLTPSTRFSDGERTAYMPGRVLSFYRKPSSHMMHS